MPTLTIQLRGEPAYPVHVGSGLLPRVAGLAKKAGLVPKRVLIVVDRRVPRAMLAQVRASFAAAACSHVAIKAEEHEKTLSTLSTIWHAAAAAKLDRDDAIIALGGGLTGDIAGFAAATYRRGIAWVQCPTTLLACVDASVGGKTAINLEANPLIKNLVGSFHQPSLVVSDVAALASLPRGGVSDGLAECIKHACLARSAATSGGATLFRRTLALIPRVLQKDPAALAQLIARNVQVKASIAGPDPRENAATAEGGRALLNLGHTFGHVLEALPVHKGARNKLALSHGQAISLGLVAAAHAGLALRTCTPSVVEAIVDALALAELPTTLPAHIDAPRSGTLAQRMLATDKKVRAGVLRIIVPVGSAVGSCKVVAAPAPEAVLAGLESIRAL